MITFTDFKSENLYQKVKPKLDLAFTGISLIKNALNISQKKRVLEYNEMVFVTDGSLIINANSKEYKLAENDLILFSANTVISYFNSLEGEVSFYLLKYTLTGDGTFNEKEEIILSDCIGRLKKLFSEIHSCSTYPEFSNHLPDLLTAYLLIEAGIIQEENNKKENQIVKNIAKWVIQNSEKKITVENAAEHFNYNKDYIGKLFKRAYGISLKKYIISQILLNAKTLLSTTSYSIKQISENLGFKGENDFVKFFKYHEKVTPMNYRNQ